MQTYNNPVLDALPAHLRQFVVPQCYERYSPVDQAVWRYVMRQNYAYLKDVAYYPYIPGLRKAGLSIERIPDLQAMNDSLSKIGWGAVTVDGFIPPSAFMEFQAHRVLVIAADIRQLEHIEYTPAPDIIHESSGHAPIIGEPEYAEYLQYFGEIGSKAMFSAQDFQLYEAIRQLSILKERIDATPTAIEAAEVALTAIQQNMGEPSEMALLSRLHWWTVEYGLIGSVDDPKIYGAGLLSSIGESASCMQHTVSKLEYTSDALHYSYDITKAQPQLFVTPDFKHLRTILDEFADTMAFRIGGKHGVDKAIASNNTCTVVYSTGLQISGTFQYAGREDMLSYIRTAGPTALAFDDQQLTHHSKQNHAHGFGSPVGSISGWKTALEDCTPQQLVDRGLLVGNPVVIDYESGVQVRGVLVDQVYRGAKLCLLSFRNCTVQDTTSNELYFEPGWGQYDMAVGKTIVSVFSGAADKTAFDSKLAMSSQKTSLAAEVDETRQQRQLYSAIRTIREKGNPMDLGNFLQENDLELSKNWLALVELLELATDYFQMEVASSIERKLITLSQANPAWRKLISDGIRLAKDKETQLLL